MANNARCPICNISPGLAVCDDCLSKAGDTPAGRIYAARIESVAGWVEPGEVPEDWEGWGEDLDREN